MRTPSYEQLVSREAPVSRTEPCRVTEASTKGKLSPVRGRIDAGPPCPHGIPAGGQGSQKKSLQEKGLVLGS